MGFTRYYTLDTTIYPRGLGSDPALMADLNNLRAAGFAYARFGLQEWSNPGWFGFDGDCETFAVPVDVEKTWNYRFNRETPLGEVGHNRPNTYWNFCKTNRHPYDVVVSACLCVMAERSGVQVSGDGDEVIWVEGAKWASRVLGREVANPDVAP